MDKLFEDADELFEEAPCGYITTGEDGRISRVNRTLANWLGRNQAEFTGRRFQDFLNLAGKIYYETHFAPLMRMQGFFNEVALDLERADGSLLPTLVNAVERRDEDGGLRFTRITIFNAVDRRRYERELLDARREAESANARLLELNRTLEERVAQAVAARLQSEQALHQAQKMEAIGQLTGGIAHDFNNMLAVVLSSLSLLRRHSASGEDISRYISAAEEGAKRAAGLTQRLLAFSRQQPLAPQVVVVDEMIDELADMLRRTLGSNVQLETNTAANAAVFVDRNLLESAIVNLAINARDAMPEGGRLIIDTVVIEVDDARAQAAAVEPGSYVKIAVTDTGSGMTPEVLAKAFDPFFTTKGPGKGTGLGLSQVFRFAHESRGFLRADSEVGRGTTMNIWLPVNR